MDTNPRSAAIRSAALTSALIAVRAIVRDVDATLLSDEQIALLHEIANFAFANAQEARVLQTERDALLAQIDEHEALMADRLMVHADAADHSIAHLL